MFQDKDESNQHFAARVKGQANLCDYIIKCTKEGCGSLMSYADAEIKHQICNGLYDPDISQDVISSAHQDLSLTETINFIAAKKNLACAVTHSYLVHLVYQRYLNTRRARN